MFEQLLAFVAAALVVIIVPGPDLMLVLRNTARAGRRGAFWTAAGIMSGLAILGSAAALGITALLSAAPTLFVMVRVAGGLYLVYLGVQALRSYRKMREQSRTELAPLTSPASETTARPAAAAPSMFRQGLLCNLLNPKVAAFYLSLFPQFDLAPLPATTQHIVLAGTFWLLCLIWYVALVSLIGRLAGMLQGRTFARRTEAVAGVALTGLGAAVLTGAR